MDQKFIAGIGNIYSDEILHHAGLRYDRMSDELRPEEVRRLYRAVVEVLQDAVKYRGSSLADEQYVDLFGKKGGYQDHHKVYARDGQACLRCRHVDRAGEVPRDAPRSSARTARSERDRSARSARHARVRSGGSAKEELRSVPEVSDAARVQVVRGQDRARVRTRRDGRRRPERLGEVEPRRRRRVGARRAGPAHAARREDGRRHLRRHRRPPGARARRGVAHDRQLRESAADRVHRGDDHPDAVPQRRLRVRDQRCAVPAPGHPGAALRQRHRPPAARHRRTGPARLDPELPPGGPARGHRGGGRGSSSTGSVGRRPSAASRRPRATCCG